MQQPVLEVDYLVMGAGAAGMAFTDSIVTDSQATVAIVDTQHRPGGHWNRAYPFVRLHQPSAFYGVNSRVLGSGARDQAGLNKGYYELASGAEVTAYFDQVMHRQFLPSGRVHYFPMSQAGDDGVVTSLVSGRQHRVKARRRVDASYSNTTVPSMRPPPFPVAAGMTCVPVNELPRVAGSGSGYVVIGAGKTGMDACVWLLENGADPDSIRWVMPRDYWWMNRATYQPGDEHFERVVESIANGVEALAGAQSEAEVFDRMEAFGEFRRIDPAVKPTGFHGGFVSDAELELIRGIRNIVRLGRVTRIDEDRVVLERGHVPTGRDIVHIDCSAVGIPPRPSRPVFEGDRITLQWIRMAQPTFSWSMIGHVEATGGGDAEKNRICNPIAPPHEPRDWIRMMGTELANQLVWSKHPGIREWQFNSRLDPFTRRIRTLQPSEAGAMAHLQRYGRHVAAAARNVPQLLA